MDNVFALYFASYFFDTLRKIRLPLIRELKQIMTTTATRNLPSKRFSDKKITVHVRYNSFTFFCRRRN